MKLIKIGLFLLIIVASCSAELSDTTRDWIIAFTIKHEGGYINYRGIEYNYGLSGKYYGNVRHIKLDSAWALYRQIWTESRAKFLNDSCMALVYFDSWVMLTPTVAKSMLVNCYDPRTYLLRRLVEQVHQVNIAPYQKDNLYSWDRRMCDLFRICGE